MRYLCTPGFTGPPGGAPGPERGPKLFDGLPTLFIWPYCGALEGPFAADPGGRGLPGNGPAAP